MSGKRCQGAVRSLFSGTFTLPGTCFRLTGPDALPRQLDRARRGSCRIAEAHGIQHFGGLGKLDVAVVDDLDAVAPGVEEVEAAARQDLCSHLRKRAAERCPVVDHEAEVAVLSFF